MARPDLTEPAGRGTASTALGGRPGEPIAGAAVAVWPLWLRGLHWSLAATVIASFITHEGGRDLHETLGWAALAVAVVRLLMGFASRVGHARFASFVQSPARTLRYAVMVLRHRAPRYIGHNPLGGWMMVLLLADVLACGFTGWLYTTDTFWGVEWVEELHSALGHAFIPLVLLHVAGAIHASRAHRENLVAAMLHGRKRAPGPNDVA